MNSPKEMLEQFTQFAQEHGECENITYPVFHFASGAIVTTDDDLFQPIFWAWVNDILNESGYTVVSSIGILQFEMISDLLKDDPQFKAASQATYEVLLEKFGAKEVDTN